MKRVPAGWALLDDVEVMDLPDPDFIVAGVLPRKGLGVLYGPSGACKTTLAAGLMVSIATGRRWFGRDVRHVGASIYVSTEDVAGFKVRLRAAKAAAGLSLVDTIGIYTFPEAIDLCDAADIARFIAFVEQTDVTPELVVVDTYAGATPGAAE